MKGFLFALLLTLLVLSAIYEVEALKCYRWDRRWEKQTDSEITCGENDVCITAYFHASKDVQYKTCGEMTWEIEACKKTDWRMACAVCKTDLCNNEPHWQY